MDALKPLGLIKRFGKRLQNECSELIISRLDGCAEARGGPVAPALHIPAVTCKLVEELDELLTSHLRQMFLRDRSSIVVFLCGVRVIPEPRKKRVNQFACWPFHTTFAYL